MIFEIKILQARTGSMICSGQSSLQMSIWNCSRL